MLLLKGKKIGIEVTNLYINDGKRPESEQMQLKVRKHVINEAQRKYLDKSDKSFEISFSFNSQYPIRNKEKLIPKFIEFATRIEALESGEVARNLYQDIPELNFVYINHTIYPDPKWRVLQVYDGQLMSPKRLEDILRAKEIKAKHYTSCDDYWLLVVVDFINSAQDQEIRIDNIKLQSNIFKKIIIYKTAYEHLVEIPTEKII
jgi:hypothetical protein